MPNLTSSKLFIDLCNMGIFRFLWSIWLQKCPNSWFSANFWPLRPKMGKFLGFFGFFWVFPIFPNLLEAGNGFGHLLGAKNRWNLGGNVSSHLFYVGTGCDWSDSGDEPIEMFEERDPLGAFPTCLGTSKMDSVKSPPFGLPRKGQKGQKFHQFWP